VCTSLLLIAAVPPLVIGYPPSKLRPTAVIMNMAIFGAVALGPVVGGIQAEAHAWRTLFWVIAAVAFTALVLAVLVFEDAPPADRSAPRDPVAVGLAAAGCVAAFYGASDLMTHRFLDASTLAPLAAGLALIVALLVHQARVRRPLLIVGPLGSTLPVAGIAVALCAAAASVSALGLSTAVLGDRYTPVHLGALFIAGFSLRNAALQRVFAIIELMRAVAAFMVAPILLHLAMTVGGSPAAGARTALWVCFGLSVGGALLAISLYVLGGVRPPTPVLERWFGGEAPAWDSPRLLAAVRRGSRTERRAFAPTTRTEP
jgi:hypothetical protein